MLTINDTSTVPPGGFRYIDPDTDARLGRPTYMAIVRDIFNHRKANNLPELNLEQLNHLICTHSPNAPCTGDTEPPLNTPDPKVVRLSGRDVIHGTRVIYALWKSGGELVKQEEAESRARICSKCPEQVEYSEDCPSCVAKLKGFVHKIVKGNKTTVDDNLKTCGVCHCTNKTQVWVPYKHLTKGMTRSMEWPDVCWKNPKNNVERSSEPTKDT